MKRVHLSTVPLFFVCIFLLTTLTSCRQKEPPRLQGYVEGEFIYVAAPLGGALEKLSVQRGSEVTAGTLLFRLESVAEKVARDEAEHRLGQARAQLADLSKGLRPAELESIEAQLKQARVAVDFSEKEFKRENELARTGASTAQELDRARSVFDQDRQRVAQLEAQLTTGRLGSRRDQIAAAEANVQALEATLAKAVWSLSQKEQSASEAGVVFDTLYREGEWVAAGRPVVALLPPRNREVRTFVSERTIGQLRIGQPLRVLVDGVSEPFAGKISFISPQAEYTPPVIYSRESRDKLVFMVEIIFEPDVAAKLQPPQPVDVQLN